MHCFTVNADISIYQVRYGNMHSYIAVFSCASVNFQYIVIKPKCGRCQGADSYGFASTARFALWFSVRQRPRFDDQALFNSVKRFNWLQSKNSIGANISDLDSYWLFFRQSKPRRWVVKGYVGMVLWRRLSGRKCRCKASCYECSYNITLILHYDILSYSISPEIKSSRDIQFTLASR